MHHKRACGIFAVIAGLMFWSMLALADKPEGKTLRTVHCDSVAAIQTALREAKPGDRIVIKPGIYTSAVGVMDSYFYGLEDGTATNPIVLESEDPSNPAVLNGPTYGGYVLYITSDYWEIKNLKITGGRQGIVLDNSNHTRIYGCEVSDIGQEGIHVRDGSSNNIIEKCFVHDTGKFVSGFGEGIYIGSDFGKWKEYKEGCNQNIITGCVIGPNVTAEHIDIKEGTTGTIIEGCTMDGTGISGEHFSDSFIDAKGNQCIIRNNTVRRNNNPKIVDAFQVHQQLDGWGIDNQFNNNTLYLDTITPFVVNAAGGSATASRNRRIPEGNLYAGAVQTDDQVFVAKTPPFSYGEVLLKDDFEDGDLAGWTQVTGSWSVETDGTKAVKQSFINNDCFLAGGSLDWTDYAVETRVKPVFFSSNNTPVSVMARFTDPNNFYYARLSSAGTLEIRKKQGNTQTLAAKNYPVALNTWYTIKFVVCGDWLICYVNGQLELAAQDGTFKFGRFALNCYKTSAVFDDVTVQKVSQ